MRARVNAHAWHMRTQAGLWYTCASEDVLPATGAQEDLKDRTPGKREQSGGGGGAVETARKLLGHSSEGMLLSHGPEGQGWGPGKHPAGSAGCPHLWEACPPPPPGPAPRTRKPQGEQEAMLPGTLCALLHLSNEPGQVGGVFPTSCISPPESQGLGPR